MERAEKQELVTSLNQVFKDTGTIVVAHYAGLTVADMTAFRAKMRDVGAGVKVAKNRLAKLALKGTDAEAVADLRVGAKNPVQVQALHRGGAQRRAG